MSVYFARYVNDDRRVKIGVTDNIEARMIALASEEESGAELLAMCAGDVATERAFHAICSQAWIEGEWYQLDHPSVEWLVNTFREGAGAKRFWSRLRAAQSMGTSPLDIDRQVVRDELQKIMDLIGFGEGRIGYALSAAYKVLHSINPMWSRRRVRAIWEAAPRRIDLFEFRDLQRAASMPKDAYREITVGMGRSNRPGTGE